LTRWLPFQGERGGRLEEEVELGGLWHVCLVDRNVLGALPRPSEKKGEENLDLARKKKNKQITPCLSLPTLIFLLLSGILFFLGALAPPVEPLRALGEHVEDRLPVNDVFEFKFKVQQ
jgi:hypothetical protein